MRIISGTWRGHGLRVPPGARATTDRVREAIFSILEEAEGRSVLDLYAGSGSLGLEALSRGARSACFVDLSRHALAAIRDNLRGKEAGAVGLVKADALDFLRREKRSYDWIFCDPPYNRVDYPALLEALKRSETLGPLSLLILESDRYHPFEIPSGLVLESRRQFGDTIIHFLHRAETAPPEEPQVA
ncbi:MAG: 16S rRNA (guanine(966)-N(2))-methyltransferase RsmD [Candidatus Zixiibacteriota bacterium]|nr:MAG: 16S rRNA (guanine(966)-N(2))-methyltransferase RsmD [candidate division Zixibacteria bacterium]